MTCLDAAGVKYAVLGQEESCTGDPGRRMGNEYVYQMLAKGNVESLDRYRPKTIVTACPHCFNTIGNEYGQFGGTYDVVHHSTYLARLVEEQDLDDAGLTALLAQHLPDLGPQAQQWIRDATAVAAYHALLGFPVVRLLVCDDAPQFQGVTADLALCWIHEGRHSKQLSPFVPAHPLVLAAFRTRSWDHSREFVASPGPPTAAHRGRAGVVRGRPRCRPRTAAARRRYRRGPRSGRARPRSPT